METKSIVRASAQAITITTLTQGDVYKRLIEQSYSADKYRAVVGIVQSVDFNGEDAMISALEVSDAKVTLKVFGEGSDLKLFSITKDEATALILQEQSALENAVEGARRTFEEKQRELAYFHTVCDNLPALTEAKTNLSIEG
ncbi:MAG: hypothetical protein E6R04_08380 [Spirochaetes bacterium]|nr:MAG: hypothetical protein E6R04_08380 [Spirochaetota bacterium]